MSNPFLACKRMDQNYIWGHEVKVRAIRPTTALSSSLLPFASALLGASLSLPLPFSLTSRLSLSLSLSLSLYRPSAIQRYSLHASVLLFLLTSYNHDHKTRSDVLPRHKRLPWKQRGAFVCTWRVSPLIAVSATTTPVTVATSVWSGASITVHASDWQCIPAEEKVSEQVMGTRQWKALGHRRVLCPSNL